jgi:hypothetical protein
MRLFRLVPSVRFQETSPGKFMVEPQTYLICNERTSRTVHAPIAERPASTMTPALAAEMQACIDRSIFVVPELH